MQEQPTPSEILATVAAFLRDVAMPQLQGHASFTARVAMNAVELVRREIELRPAADHRELARLAALLGQDGSLEALNGELASQIRDGRIDIHSTALLEHLWQTTMDKLAIDQPAYASYQDALKGSGAA
ncbi:hypothetical protein SAMN05428950_102442 [Sphingomonas sp. OV641]|uniref:DUF6285 domain-containing protein n=1 Tax=Sphingomonas sp. OV641 TaxID=1881068 RepID=UPI0008D8050C|nr:DUF6285 domain-containing protein [Sphingomonas sp. OV641]SEJ66007.1 hypothetical protein SAMN05428950_102442 [Sphingomonas sp. OV641]